MLIEFEIKQQLPFLTIINMFEGFKQVPDVILDQQGTTQNPHDLNDRTSNLKIMFNDCNETVGDDSNMYLDSYSILGFAPKGLDAKMLLDPFKEQLDLPAVTVQKCDVTRIKVEVVCIVNKRPMKILSIIDNSSERHRIVLFIAPSQKSNCLVTEDIVFSIKKVFTLFNFIVWAELLSNDEECSCLFNMEESGKVKVSSVKDITGIWLISEPVHVVEITEICIADSVEYRNLCGNINLRMDFDAGLGASELSPSEYGHTNINCCRVNGIKPSMQFKIFGNTLALSNRSHMEGKLLKDTIVSKSISLGKYLPVDRRFSETQKEGLSSMCNCNICEFSKTAASQQLTKYQNQQLIPMRHRPISGPIVVIGNQAPEESLRKKLNNLRKNIVPRMHNCSIFDLDTKVQNSKVGQGFRELCYCA